MKSARFTKPRKLTVYVTAEQLAWLHQMARREREVISVETLAAEMLSATINEHRELQRRGKAA